MLTIGNAMSSSTIQPSINPQPVNEQSNRPLTQFQKSIHNVRSSPESLSRSHEREDLSIYAQDMAYRNQRPVLISSHCHQTTDGSTLCKIQKDDGLCTVIKEQVCENPHSSMAESIDVSEEVCNQLRTICNN